jgi:hypothetical protein
MPKLLHYLPLFWYPGRFKRDIITQSFPAGGSPPTSRPDKSSRREFSVKENHQVVVGSRPEPDVESHSSRQNNPVNDKTTIQLTRIGQQLLALDSIGIDQNFFDLERESSLAFQMFAQIESVFSMRLLLATLREASTNNFVGRLAEALRKQLDVSMAQRFAS